MLDKILREQYEKFTKGPFSFHKILEQIIKTELDEQDIVFLLGYIKKKKLSIYSHADRKWIRKDIGENKDIKALFEEVSNSKNRALEYCRCIGRTDCVDMYCYIALEHPFDIIDSTYIQAVCKNYYQWISYYFTGKLREENASENLFKNDTEREKEMFFRECADSFYEYVQDIYQIDLDIITSISGTYYESSSCCSQMAFILSDMEDNSAEQQGIIFREPIKVGLENVRKIRKLLQMGKESMCLCAYWNREGKIWEIRGLYKKEGIEGLPCIVFRMMQHMVWQMEVGERIAVRYNCGRYFIESEKLELLKIKKKFRSIFHEESGSEIEEAFQGAIRQSHGTILAVLDNDGGKTEQEVLRLLNDSTGIGICPDTLSSAFVQSASAIDGAVIVDKAGKCYGIGMILDGLKSKGNPERGARYNSALKYIEKCKRAQIKAMVIVVSEDKTIDIHLTEK